MRSFEIQTDISERSQIMCGTDVFSSIGERVSFVFTDENVLRLYGKLVEEKFPSVPVYAMPAGEEHKRKETLFALLQAMADAELHRGDTILNLGGGVVGDLGGLAGALYMRGIDCIQVPTTLLAQVDSSVGGKTAIDFCGVKNLIGAFRQPKRVYVDPRFLATLPERELLCGLGEIVKHAALNAALFDKLIKNRSKLCNLAFLSEIVPDNIAIKADVVRRDARESGLRRCLNLGHTTAHAFELCDNRLSHGEYVLIGTLFEAEIARAYPDADKNYLDELEALIFSLIGRIALPPAREAVRFALLDKKNGQSGVTLVLPFRKGNYREVTLSYEDYLNQITSIQEKIC